MVPLRLHPIKSHAVVTEEKQNKNKKCVADAVCFCLFFQHSFVHFLGVVNIKQSVRGEEMQAGAGLGGGGGVKGGTLLVPSLSGGVTGGGGRPQSVWVCKQIPAGALGTGGFTCSAHVLTGRTLPSYHHPHPILHKKKKRRRPRPPPTHPPTQPQPLISQPPLLQQGSVWSAQTLQCCRLWADVWRLKDSHLPSLTRCQRSWAPHTVEASPVLLDFCAQTFALRVGQPNVGREKKDVSTFCHW